MAEQRSQAERWVSFAAGIVTPITLVTGLLFYFGYVSARAQYEYFGIDVDTIGLSTQDYVMRSPQPLLVPLLVLTVIAVGAVLLHHAIQPTPTGVRRARLISLGLLLLGVLGLFVYPLIGSMPFYALIVPAVLGISAAVLGYLTYLRGTLDPGRGKQPALIALLALVTVTSAFWATATTAQYSGRGLAKSDAEHLNRFPVVVLDTREQLSLRNPLIEETALRAGPAQTYRYRYRGLRLLVVGKDRLFLVPHTWTASNTTLVLPLNDSIRVQFQFQNDPP